MKFRSFSSCCCLISCFQCLSIPSHGFIRGGLTTTKTKTSPSSLAKSFLNIKNSRQVKKKSIHSTDVSFSSSLSAYGDDGTTDAGTQGIGVGIDLGTTNSAIAYLDGDEPRIIEIPNNGRTMKSVVAFDKDGTELVGRDAIEWEYTENKCAYRHVKRIMGVGANTIPQETIDVVPHVIVSSSMDDDDDDDEDPAGGKNKKNTKNKKKKNKKQPTLSKILMDASENPTMLADLHDPQNNKQLLPEMISSVILRKLIDTATEHTGKQITRAVIGVPAYFNDEQRDATIRAANEAGIDKVKLLREPEAAALAYGVDKSSSPEEEFVLVFDLGGGTYDVSILLLEKGLTEIICTSGNAQLGGSNFDAKIAKHLASTSGCSTKYEASLDAMIRVAEGVRIFLSNNKVATLSLPVTEEGWAQVNDVKEVLLTNEQDDNDDTDDGDGTNRSDPSARIVYKLTRREMEDLCFKEFQQLMKPIREACIMAGALLPGDARPSLVETAIEIDKSSPSEGDDLFFEGDDYDEFVGHKHDDTASGSGTTTATTTTTSPDLNAIDEEQLFSQMKKNQQKGRKKARALAKEEKKYRAETQKLVGGGGGSGGSGDGTMVRTDGITGRPITRVVLVGGATRMPAIGRLLSVLTGITPQKTVDPDEAVALGCAVHVGVLDGREEMGTVLNPMQAAILRAVIEKQRREGTLDESLIADAENFEF